MTDQNINTENINDEELNTEKPPVDKAKETQTLIDNAIKTRLARERETTKALQAQWDDERQALLEENKLLRAEFQSKLDQQLSEIPTSFRGLISKLPIAEQILWLTEQKKEQEAKPKTPPIPNFNKKDNKDGKGEIKHMPIDRIV